MMPTNGLSFRGGVDCQSENEWCRYQEPHEHGSFDCDKTCPCRTCTDDLTKVRVIGQALPGQ